MSRARKGNIMTPEEAYELGKQVSVNVADTFAEEFGIESADPILDDVENEAKHRVSPELAPMFIRGAASFWRERVEALEARAAALEATR